MKRGEIWWASLPTPYRSGPGSRRPVVIVQSNPFNSSRIGTIVVAAITSNIALGEAPGNVTISAGKGGLRKKSVVNVSQLLTISKELLTERVGKLSNVSLHRLDDGLRLVLAL